MVVFGYGFVLVFSPSWFGHFRPIHDQQFPTPLRGSRIRRVVPSLVLGRFSVVCVTGTAQKTFVKGFKIDQAKVVTSAKLRDPDLTIIESYITTIVHILNREGYKYIGCAYDHDPDPQDGKRRLVLIIVLDESTDEEELKNKALGQIDDTIEWAKPHVLEGPDVWELWG